MRAVPQPQPSSPDLDLAMAFFGSILTGIASGGLTGYLTANSHGALLGTTLGVFAGVPWGYLSVIAAAIATPAARRRTILTMLLTLAVGLKVVITAIWIAAGSAG